MSAALLVVSLLAAQPSEQPRVFALLVGNNLSASPGRPTLKYADDDMVMLAEALSVVTSPANMRILARVDGPGTPVKTDLPTRRALDRAAAELADLVQAARDDGEKTVLVLAYSGHGDVKGGHGVLELEDGALDGPALNALIDTVNPDVTHLVLDACNAFHVLIPRGPGGVIMDRDPSLSTRGDVGIIAASSRSSQTFESDELRSGVFSFLFRSAITGAADADLDDVIGYDEMEAFLETAASGLTDTVYQPLFFVRPPDDEDALIAHHTPSSLLVPGGEGAHGVQLPGGIPVVTVHPERGHIARLHLPARPLEVTQEAGTGTLRGTLFSSSFGPRAVERHRASLAVASEEVLQARGDDERITRRQLLLILGAAALPAAVSLVGHAGLVAVHVVMLGVIALSSNRSPAEALGMLPGRPGWIPGGSLGSTTTEVPDPRPQR